MQNIKIKDILKATNGRLISGNIEEEIKNIVIDSRKANSDNTFVAIIGENLDGHDFLLQSASQGCKTFIVSKENNSLASKSGLNIILVEDTQLAMGDIGKYYKNRFNIPFIGVTGSVGKTTTRDFIYSALNSTLNTHKNIGNLNNHLGVPLTLFELDKNHECAVIEMGMSHFKEIEYLADMVHPKIAVISNIGVSHIENLGGTQDGIFEAKMEITKNFGEDNLLVINGDDEYLSRLKNENLNYRIKSFGFNKDNDIYCKNYLLGGNSTKFTCVIRTNRGGVIERDIILPIPGKHNILNAMAAILVGMELNLNLDNIVTGLTSYSATKGRMDIIEKENITIIDSCYNASPDSMKAALGVLSSFTDKRRIAILGDMFEMGDLAVKYHKLVGEYAVGNADILITVGDNAKYMIEEAVRLGMDKSNTLYFETKLELINNLKDILKYNGEEVVLVKASRGMKLEEVIDAI